MKYVNAFFRELLRQNERRHQIWKVKPCLYIRKLNIVKMSVLSKLTQSFSPIPNKISAIFFVCGNSKIYKELHCKRCKGFPCGSAGKESTYNAEDLGSIPGSGRSPGEGNGNPLQYSCLEKNGLFF